MNALSINIPANFIATCESTLAKYSAAHLGQQRTGRCMKQATLE